MSRAAAFSEPSRDGGPLGRCRSCGETELAVDACRDVSISLLRGQVVAVRDLGWTEGIPAILFCAACGVETALDAGEVGRLVQGGLSF